MDTGDQRHVTAHEESASAFEATPPRRPTTMPMQHVSYWTPRAVAQAMVARTLVGARMPAVLPATAKANVISRSDE